MASKLSDQHLDQVYRLRAEGHGYTSIARWLQNSDATGLDPVVVDESAVRHRCRSSNGRAEINEWRVRLFGNIFETRASFTGWRLEQLALLLERAHKEAGEATDDAHHRSWSRLAVKLSREMRKELDRLGENELPGRVYVSNDNGQSTEVQSPELSTLIDTLVNVAHRVGG